LCWTGGTQSTERSRKEGDRRTGSPQPLPGRLLRLDPLDCRPGATPGGFPFLLLQDVGLPRQVQRDLVARGVFPARGSARRVASPRMSSRARLEVLPAPSKSHCSSGTSNSPGSIGSTPWTRELFSFGMQRGVTLAAVEDEGRPTGVAQGSGFGGRRDQMLRKPTRRLGGHLLQSARLLEEVGGAGRHLQAADASDAPARLAVPGQYGLISSADDEQSRGRNTLQVVAGEIGAAAARPPPEPGPAARPPPSESPRPRCWRRTGQSAAARAPVPCGPRSRRRAADRSAGRCRRRWRAAGPSSSVKRLGGRRARSLTGIKTKPRRAGRVHSASRRPRDPCFSATPNGRLLRIGLQQARRRRSDRPPKPEAPDLGPRLAEAGRLGVMPWPGDARPAALSRDAACPTLTSLDTGAGPANGSAVVGES